MPELRERGELPSWANLDLASQYNQLRGGGTLWLDADGLPAKLKLDIQLPAPKGASASQATLTSDFSGYDHARLALASTRFLDSPFGWLRCGTGHGEAGWRASGAGGCCSIQRAGERGQLETPAFTAVTNAGGAASVPARANGEAGTYGVDASAAGVGAPASFALTNDPDGPTPSPSTPSARADRCSGARHICSFLTLGSARS